MKLSRTELTALSLLESAGGSLLTSMIEAENMVDLLWGDTVPGLTVYRKLEKKGLVLITEEEPMEDGFCFTPTIELTDLGKVELRRS